MFRPLLDALILVSTGYSLAGWILSLFHSLNFRGYLLASLLIAGSVFFYLKKFYGRKAFPYDHQVGHCSRFRKWLPRSFLTLSVLILLASLCHEPNNHDGLSYRIPRVLHWLSHGGWFWTGNSDTRMDTRSVGFEWLSAPFLALLHTDRLIFLWNWVGFLFLPSLVFQLSRRLGAAGPVAWNWMWLLPSAYGIVLQAGSIGNDAIGGVFFLASLALATGRSPVPFRDLALSALAMAMCAGIKSTNVLWGLPWLCAIFPQTKTFFRRPWRAVCLLVVCLTLSSFPIWLSNQLRCGDWTGEKVEGLSDKPITLTDPVTGIAGNLILLGIQNAAPPAWPWVRPTTDFVRTSLPPSLVVPLSKSFEGGFQDLGIRELPGEEGTGLGLGLALLSLLAFFAFLGAKPWGIAPPSRSLRVAWLVTPISILIYASKMAISCPARIILPSLMFLVLGLSALPNQQRLIRSKIWRWAALFAMGSSLLVLILTPSRPLLPRGVLLQIAEKSPISHATKVRIRNVYEVYAHRARAFDPLLGSLPSGVSVLGYTGGAALEAALWKPYGKRTIVWVPPQGLLAAPPCPHPEILIASAETIRKSTGLEPETWIRRVGASVLAQKPITFLVRNGPELFYLLKLSSSSPPSP